MGVINRRFLEGGAGMVGWGWAVMVGWAVVVEWAVMVG